MKKPFFLLSLLSLPALAQAADFNPFGLWECSVEGDEGLAQLSIDHSTHIFSLQLPIGFNFKTQFKPLLADEDKIGIILLTPDHIAHPLNLIKNGNGMIVQFYGEKMMPDLYCERPEEKEPIGH